MGEQTSLPDKPWGGPLAGGSRTLYAEVTSQTPCPSLTLPGESPGGRSRTVYTRVTSWPPPGPVPCPPPLQCGGCLLCQDQAHRLTGNAAGRPRHRWLVQLPPPSFPPSPPPLPHCPIVLLPSQASALLLTRWSQGAQEGSSCWLAAFLLKRGPLRGVALSFWRVRLAHHQSLHLLPPGGPWA